MLASRIRGRILLAIGLTGAATAAMPAGCGGTTSTGGGTTFGDVRDAGPDASDDAAADGGADTASDSSPAESGGRPDGPACVRRPFLVGSELRACGVRARTDWSRALDPAEGLDRVTAAALEAAWLEDARQEHASVAAFARFTMMLLAVGAPPDLVLGSQRASIDEVAHARACFALASRYGARDYGPAELSLEGALAQLSLAELAALTVHEGCVGETLGALLAAEQLARAEDPEVRALLVKLVKDEQRHAELAWRFVRWALAAGGPAVRQAVVRAFEEAEREVRRQVFADEPAIDVTAWRAHGRLDAAASRRILAEGLSGIVRPCAAALLAPEDRAAGVTAA